MKKILLSVVLIAGVLFAQAQFANPVQWTFTSKKIADKTFEVYLTANIQSGWHLYSQNQPKDAVNIPTEVLFNKNPLVTIDGKTAEVGKMELYRDKKLKISANQYANKVVFVQKIKVKSAAKTTISGSLEYQTCDDKKCLPPKKELFKVALK
jgi:DsbC/DsbD-like thiol-disulfide interchange protein